jgi:hypothetical protein
MFIRVFVNPAAHTADLFSVPILKGICVGYGVSSPPSSRDRRKNTLGPFSRFVFGGYVTGKKQFSDEEFIGC